MVIYDDTIGYLDIAHVYRLSLHLTKEKIEETGMY